MSESMGSSSRRASVAPMAASARVRALRILAVALLVIGVGVSAFVWQRRAHEGSTAPAAAPRDVPHVEGKRIRFSREFGARSGVELQAAEVGALQPTISVTGTAAFNPESVAAIGARIAGRVRRVFKYPGDVVKKGEVLAELESAELGQAQAAVLSARAHLEAAAANESREKQLAEARISSQRDYELARASAQASRVELQAAEQRVRAMAGGSGIGEVGVLPLTSPIDGKVVELKVSRGQSVDSTTTAFKVADIRTLWIELAVFERELGHVRSGDKVEIAPQTNTQMVVTGKVAHVGDVIDQETRSAPVRVEIDNSEEKLRPGQSVVAKIHTQTAPQALVVPRDAVTTVDGKPTVFVAHDDVTVEPRTVVLGARDGARVEIRQGLDAGDRIVVKGVFALKSEVFR